MRKVAIVVVTFLVFICGWAFYSKASRRRREASYQTKLLPLRKALPNGMPKSEVARYLDSHGLVYDAARYPGSPNWACEVKIAEEPGDHLVCAKWTIFAVMDFSADQTLTDVHLGRVGTCL
jgi:hypothetical protein